MKVKELLPILYDVEQVRINKADEADEWSGYAFSIPQRYYNDKIDRVCSYPDEYFDSFTYIFIK